MPLTDIAVRQAKPKQKPYKMADGDGMYLQVEPHGGKNWRMKYRFNGKEKKLALGTYPEVSLFEARERRFEARKLLAKGIDPSAKKAEDKREALESAGNTFAILAKQWHEANKAKWTPNHGAVVWRRMELHVVPELGHRPIRDIKPQDVLAVIRKVESRDTTELSHRLAQQCAAVFRYAVVTGKADYNPAADLRGALKSHKAQHYPALTAKEVPGLLEKLAKVKTSDQNKLAVRLLMHTFVRQGEMRQAKWSHIDWEAKEWRLPAEITKMREEHVVPLSAQAIAIMRELQAITGHHASGLLFPSQHYQKKPMMCENTINNLLKKMGYKGKMVGHGFRALASTTLNEMGFMPDVIERQLAHRERNKVRAAYNRAEYLDDRRRMMQVWSDRLEALESGKVIEGRFRRVA